MHPLLLLAIVVGGGAWLFGKAKAAESPLIRGGRGMLQSTALSKLVVTGKTEKFEDPLYGIYGAEGMVYTIAPTGRPAGLARILNRPTGMNDQQTDPVVGYEYLASVPNDAVSRINAIRARIIAANVKPIVEGYEDNGTVLGKMVDASTKTLGETAKSLVRSYNTVSSSADRAAAVAAKLGVDTSAVQHEASTALSSAASSASASTSFAVMNKAVKDYGPIARTVAGAVATAIRLGGSSSGQSTQETTEQALDAAGSVIMLIPVYGWIVGAAVRGVGAILGALRKSDNERCHSELESVQDALGKAAGNKMPIPWRLFDVFTPDCTTGYSLHGNATSDGMMSLLSASERNRYYTSSVMPPTWQVHVQRWWAAAQTYAAEPRVHEVFAALGGDASGGMVASDEQVMLVAAPIAVMYGYDINELAVALWKKSPGWRAASEAFRGPLPEKVMSYRPHVTDDEIRKAKNGLRALTEGIDFDYIDLCSMEEWKTYCAIPHNAWWLQWGVLARDAFEIVEEWQKTRVLTMNLGAFKLGGLKGLKL